MENNNEKKLLPMPKEVSALNTYWLLLYIERHHPELDLRNLLEQISQMFPCFIENIRTGTIEQISIEHLQNPRYWFSHRFVHALHTLIQDRIPDPRLGFKMGRTIYQTQPLLKTALGIPFLGTHAVARRVSREAAKFNRTKQYHVQRLDTGVVDIRIIHDPGVVVGEFAMQWNAGCFASYARLAGAADISADIRCIDPGPTEPDAPGKAVWDIELRYQEPGRLTRLAKAAMINIPWIRALAERAEAVEDEHREQILNRDNIIRARTAELARANKAMSMEIGERKQAESALLRTQKQLQRYIASIDDIGLGVCIINEDYSIQAMNRTLTGWFGDSCGKSCHCTLMDREHPCSACQLNDIIRQRKKVRYTPVMSDGRTFEVVATPIVNDDGTISKMVIFHDITKQKLKEEQRIKINQQEEQLKKLASLKTMAGAIAHRFNNAMTGVQGNLELMTFNLPEDSGEYQMASRALQTARGASQIGSMMLSYVGQKSLHFQEVSLVDFAREHIMKVGTSFNPTVFIECIPPEQTLYCSIDPPHIQEVLQNLLNNAVESLVNGTGAIEITFGSEYVAAHSLPTFFQDSNLPDGEYVFCQIKDSGQGVSPENIEQIFDPFYTTRATGRGLGLAFAGGIMQAHGGAITIASIPNSGSSVRVLFPAIAAPVGTLRPSTANGAEVAALAGDVLLADDEPIVVIAIRMMLEHLGFTVHTVENGKEAVARVFCRDVEFRAVVMDILMPEMGGLEAMKEIRKIAPALPVLLISGYYKDAFPIQEDKPDVFLTKPVLQADLRSALEMILSRN